MKLGNRMIRKLSVKTMTYSDKWWNITY